MKGRKRRRLSTVVVVSVAILRMESSVNLRDSRAVT